MRKRHGFSKTRLYRIWSGIRDRCINNHKSAKTYKEKGICICEEWSDFTVFRKWSLDNGYTDDLTIDRLNINGNYEPNNCEWVTREENTRRQVADGHGHQTQILINEIPYKSVAEASRFIKKQTKLKIKVSSIKQYLYRIIYSEGDGFYKGFSVKKLEGNEKC